MSTDVGCLLVSYNLVPILGGCSLTGFGAIIPNSQSASSPLSDSASSSQFSHLLTWGKKNTGDDRYSGHGYSGIDRFSETKTPDDAILFTVSGITAIVEQKIQKFRFYLPKGGNVMQNCGSKKKKGTYGF